MAVFCPLLELLAEGMGLNKGRISGVFCGKTFKTRLHETAIFGVKRKTSFAQKLGLFYYVCSTLSKAQEESFWMTY